MPLPVPQGWRFGKGEWARTPHPPSGTGWRITAPSGLSSKVLVATLCQGRHVPLEDPDVGEDVVIVCRIAFEDLHAAYEAFMSQKRLHSRNLPAILVDLVIDQRGDVFQATDYWVPASIRQVINANDKLTIYVQYGDYIGRLSAFVAVFLILIAISYWLRKGRR